MTTRLKRFLTISALPGFAAGLLLATRSDAGKPGATAGNRRHRRIIFIGLRGLFFIGLQGLFFVALLACPGRVVFFGRAVVEVGFLRAHHVSAPRNEHQPEKGADSLTLAEKGP